MPDISLPGAPEFTSIRLMMRYRHVSIAFLVLLIGFCSHRPAVAGAPPGQSVTATVVFVPGIRAEDLSRPELSAAARMINEGQSGWIVCRAARPVDPDMLRPDGRESIDSLMLTLGCGARARIAANAEHFLSPTLHQLHTQPFPPQGAVASMKSANSGIGYPVVVGGLGLSLHQVGVRVAAMGNFDSAHSDRSIYLFAMDQHGFVDDAGQRLSKTLPRSTAPFGIVGNIDRNLYDLDQIYSQDRLRVIGFGDLYRADQYTPFCPKALAAAHRTNALLLLNQLLIGVLQRAEDETKRTGNMSRVVLISPGPADSTADRLDTLAPVVLWGPGIEHGLITSSSTRRIGMAINTDFTATLLTWFNAPRFSGQSGQPFRLTSARVASVADLVRIHEQTVASAKNQDLLGGLPTGQALLVAGSSIALLAFNRKRLAGALIAVSAWLPVGMLVLPATGNASATVSCTELFLFSSIVLGLVATRRVTAGNAIKTACFTLVAAIAADLLTGCHLLQNGWMSYSAADGSRFYGIGNEYMGATLGALVALVVWIPYIAASNDRTAGRIPPRLYFIAFALMAALMVLPFSGAKVGAAPTLSIAAFAIFAVWKRGRLTIQDIALGVTAAAILIGSAALIDAHSATHTHLLTTATSGSGGILATVKRKLLMEMRLIVHSPWMVTLLTAGFSALALARSLKNSARSEQSDRTRKALFAGASAGAVVAFAVNDAGVLAAAMVLIYLCCGLSAMALENSATALSGIASTGD